MRSGFFAAWAVFLAVGLVFAYFAGADLSGLPGGIAGAATLFALYFLPAIVAAYRHHPSANAITALNLLLGWTLIGWVAALVWALVGIPAVAIVPVPEPSSDERVPCPRGAEAILPSARVCRFCRHELPAGWAPVQAGGRLAPRLLHCGLEQQSGWNPLVDGRAL
jgi:hypothetical protein